VKFYGADFAGKVRLDFGRRYVDGEDPMEWSYSDKMQLLSTYVAELE
jgi:hypothetical protein